MANPGEFLQACVEGKVWVYCSQCDEAKQLSHVKSLDCIGDENYWGAEPWWHDIRVFECCDCRTVQESKIELQM